MLDEVEREGSAIVQVPSIGVHVRENSDGTEEVGEIEPASTSSADQVDRIGPRLFQVTGHGWSVAKGSEQEPVRLGGVGYGASSIVGHEDHFLIPPYLTNVRVGQGN